MFDSMEWERHSTDELEQQLSHDEQLIATLRARQLAVLEVLDTRQVATADGSRSLGEWLAGRIDVGSETARSLVRTMRRTIDLPELRNALAQGVSFERIEALSRTGQQEDFMLWADVSRIRHEAAKQARVTADAETRTASDRFLVMQPTLDKTWWKMWGGLDGALGEIVDKSLTEKADGLPAEADGMSQSWRRATALAETFVSDDPAPAQVSVFIDAEQASGSSGEAGITLESGTRVGRLALEAILCDSNLEVTVQDSAGVPMAYGRKHRVVPPALKRALLQEAGNRCAADGCNSRNRLQVHHITPWSRGGATDPDNLVVLCWYHHHVVVHQHRLEVVLYPDRRRVRFGQPQRGPPERASAKPAT